MLRCFIFSVITITAFLTFSQTANSRGKSFKVEGVAQEAIGQVNGLIEKDNQFVIQENARRQSYQQTNSTAEENYSCKIVCRTSGLLYDTRDLGLHTIKTYSGALYDRMSDICDQLSGGWYPANTSNDCEKQ